MIYEFFLANPGYYIPLLVLIRNKKVIKLTFNILNQENVIIYYLDKLKRYNIIKDTIASENLVKMYGFKNEAGDYFIDYILVKDLVEAKQVIESVLPITDTYFKDKIKVKCEWISEVHPKGYLDELSAEMERYVYNKDKDLIYIVDNIVPEAATKDNYSFTMRKPLCSIRELMYYRRQYPLKTDYYAYYDSLTSLFEEINIEKASMPLKLEIVFVDTWNMLPVVLCRSISLEELKKYENYLKLLEITIRYYYTGSNKGEHIYSLSNFYGHLKFNRNLKITEDIYTYLKSINLSISIDIEDTNTNCTEEQKLLLEIIKDKYGDERIYNYYDVPYRLRYNLFCLSDSILQPYYTEIELPDNYCFSYEFTLNNILTLSLEKKSTIVRPFYKEILDDVFINRLLTFLMQHGFGSENWYEELRKTLVHEV